MFMLWCSPVKMVPWLTSFICFAWGIDLGRRHSLLGRPFQWLCLLSSVPALGYCAWTGKYAGHLWWYSPVVLLGGIAVRRMQFRREEHRLLKQILADDCKTLDHLQQRLRDEFPWLADTIDSQDQGPACSRPSE